MGNEKLRQLERAQVAFIIRAAVRRRHLSDDQRAVLAARLREPLSAAAKKERAEKAINTRWKNESFLLHDVSNKNGQKNTRDEVAQQLNVPRRKTEKAIALDKQAPALADKVLAGEMSLLDANRQIKEQRREASRKENRQLIERAPAIAANEHYKTIVIDPPWDWGDEGDVDQFGRARPTYATMGNEKLRQLERAQVAFIIRAAVRRRHLSDDQRAVLGERLREAISTDTGGEALSGLFQAGMSLSDV